MLLLLTAAWPTVAWVETEVQYKGYSTVVKFRGVRGSVGVPR